MAVQLSSVVKVLPQMNLFGIASVGQGHSSYTTDLACDSFDLVGKPGEKGTLYAPLQRASFLEPNIISLLRCSPTLLVGTMLLSQAKSRKFHL